MAANTPPPVGIDPSIPLPVQRDLRTVADFAFKAHADANEALAGVSTSVQKTPKDLLDVSSFVGQQLQANGKFPLSIASLPGGFNLTRIGPGAGTYTIGAKLTSGGTNGTITVDAYGRITEIQQAT